MGAKGFMALYTNGALGDLMPRFDSYNRTAVMDLHGRRIAAKAMRAWRAAGVRLRRKVDVGVRWTRSCYCGQEVEPGHRVSDTPFWGLAFFGGSEDGASIFHEPASTEGRRLPEDASHPVHGRKILVTRGIVHEVVPEVHVVRVGDRLLLGAPGEPSVEMGRRFEDAVRPQLPPGVREPVVVGLANDYMGYLTTPEEYQMQHYEGGHTVYGIWTSLLVRDGFVALSRSLATGEASPEPDQPAALGGTDPGAFPAGDAEGSITEEPPASVSRFDTVSIAWTGSGMGVDRPVDKPFVTLERMVRGHWRTSDTDLGLAFIWREEGGDYSARYEMPADEPLGPPPPARPVRDLRPAEQAVRGPPLEGAEASGCPEARQATRGRCAEPRTRRRARDPLALHRADGRQGGAAGGEAPAHRTLAGAAARVDSEGAAAGAQGQEGEGGPAEGRLREPDSRPRARPDRRVGPACVARQHRHGGRPHAGRARRR